MNRRSRIVAQLVQEGFLVPDLSEKKARYFVIPDRTKPFAKFQPCLTYARNMLLTNDCELLVWMARMAYKNDDTEFSGVIVDLLSEAELLQFLKVCIAQRGDTFRTDGADTLVFGEWARRHCNGMLSFLRELLEPAIALPTAFELDETKIRHVSLKGGNLRNVENVCDKIVAAFIKISPEQCCPLVLHLIKVLREEDATSSSNNAVLLLVLRILTPAVISPEKFGLYDGSILPTERRALLMIAKVLQQISNGILVDEDHDLYPLNGLIATHSRPLNSFVDSIASLKSFPDCATNVDDPVGSMQAVITRLPLYMDEIIAGLKPASGEGMTEKTLTFGIGENSLHRKYRFMMRFSSAREPKLLHVDGIGATGDSDSDSGTFTVFAAKKKVSVVEDLRPSWLKATTIPETMEEAMAQISPSQQQVMDIVKTALESDGIFYSVEFLATAMRAADWSAKRGQKILRKHHSYYRRQAKKDVLRIADVEEMVMGGILLVDPRLKTVSGRRCMFMRPARFFPSKMKTSKVIALLQYMTARLTEDITTQHTGFTFVADLGNWKMTNFSQSYAFSWFLTMLVMPVKMDSFIIIDAPSWFGGIWAVIKTAMSQSFRDKWSYVTRDTIDTVLAPEHRFADIADGTLDINLAVWCQDRREAEHDIVSPFIESVSADRLNAKALSRKLSSRRSLVSSASSSVPSSPRLKSKHGSYNTSEGDDDDSALSEVTQPCLFLVNLYLINLSFSHLFLGFRGDGTDGSGSGSIWNSACQKAR